MHTPALFDLAGIVTKAGQHGQPVLKCPNCGYWREWLALDGTGAFACWRCRRQRTDDGTSGV